jgi:putative aminopeptidase FrvX
MLHPAFDILKIPTAPGSEDFVANFIRNWLRKFKVPFTEDRYGNMMAVMRCSKRKEGMAFSVHMDHPGFGIREIKKKNIFCDFLGGVPKDYFRKGVPVEFFDREGAISGTGQVQRVLQWDRKRRGILVSLKKGSVDPKGFGMWKLPVLKHDSKGTHVINRVCDDLAGCAAVLAMISNLAKQKKSTARGRVYAVFTRREEIGLEGAFEIAAAKRIPKKVRIISVETSKALPNAPQGGGPIIRVGDRSSIFDPQLTKGLCVLAASLQKKNSKFKFQRKLMDGGTCEATAFLQKGYVAGGICVALGNYHNCNPSGKIAAENIHLADWNGLVQLMTEAAKML